MAPTDTIIDWQTTQIINCLFQNEGQVASRQLAGCIESDGPAGVSDDFDPVVIADKLRTVADALNDDVTFRAALADLQKAAAQEAVEAVFNHAVEALCQTPVFQSAEVASEVRLITASVALGLKVIKLCPDLKSKVKGAMKPFLNKQVTQQGGWEKIEDKV